MSMQPRMSLLPRAVSMVDRLNDRAQARRRIENLEATVRTTVYDIRVLGSRVDACKSNMTLALLMADFDEHARMARQIISVAAQLGGARERKHTAETEIRVLRALHAL